MLDMYGSSVFGIRAGMFAETALLPVCKRTAVFFAVLCSIAKCDVIYKVENGKIAQTNLEE